MSDTWHQRRLAAARKTPIIKLSNRHADALGGGRHDRQPQGVKTYFWRHLYINTIFLPRQARDKHRETSKRVCFEYKFDLSSSTKGLSRKHLYEGLKVRRRHFLSTFSIEKIILPRQTRDKHRENSPKSAVFLQGSLERYNLDYVGAFYFRNPPAAFFAVALLYWK